MANSSVEQRGTIPSNTAWFEGERKVSYAEADRRVTRLGKCARASLGMKTGDRVAMLLNNSPQALETMLATMRAGLVIVPLNVRLHPDEHGHILIDSGCSTLIYDARFAPRCGLCEASLPSLRTTVAVGGELAEGDLAYDELAVARVGYPGRPAGARRPGLAVLHVGNHGQPQGRDAHPPESADHGQHQPGRSEQPAADDVLLHALPISFAGGLFMLHHLAQGATHIFMPRFEPTAFFEAVEQYRVTTDRARADDDLDARALSRTRGL